MLFWIFLVRCSSRSIVTFLIVSKEIQKYDQRKLYFFPEKKHFQIWYARSSLKKNRKKNVQFFFPYTKIAKQKNRNKQNFDKKIPQNSLFRKHQIQKKFAKILSKKNLRRNIFVKRKIFAKKNSIIRIFTKKTICRKKISYNKFCEKKNSKKILPIIFAIFILKKKKVG